ncbi:MAG TPA: alpha-amylase family glycosyl hydrolase [Methylobacter sp.]|jgi:1,4-alpha-glucan branching enzyme
MTHLFTLKKTAFVLWNPHRINPHPPTLVIGQFQAGNPPSLANRQVFPLTQQGDLWSIDAAKCKLIDGQVYHYWFEVSDSSPTRDGSRIVCTDPTAFTVDWRLPASKRPAPYSMDDQYPAAVVKFQNGQLVPCDPGGETFDPAQQIAMDRASPNDRIVIYELPTSWARTNIHSEPEIGVGTFRDVIALVDENADAANFAGTPALQPGRSHLGELGVNALELLPLADSYVDREWGYATSNYFAPDYDLGFPSGNSSPTANTDLVNLVTLCHDRGIRFFIDVVMAFGTRAALENVNFPDFHINADAEPNDPDANQSGGQGRRNGFGGKLWRYGRFEQSYDPVGGTPGSICPARQFMKAYLLRWMADFAVDGVRMDSVNNVANWDFVQEFKDLARQTWKAKGGTEDRFLVVGEELSVPMELLTQNRLDGLWNEEFKRMLRSAILGQNSEKEPSFEWTVRKMIDCRNLGFRDGAEAVNYVGSHDVEGFRNERLFNFLQNNGIVFTEERIKLAFVCLLTAVGIPMIFAGDEFADQHDLSVSHPPKQRDAVNYERLNEPFRRRVFDYVARLVKFRTSYDALAVNDTEFIHVDFNDGKRVLCWRRGQPGSDRQVVVVANFSDFITADALSGNSEYRVANWPATPHGKKWREITQERNVPAEWVAREPIFPWEAKVYALVNA